MALPLKIINSGYFNEYSEKAKVNWRSVFNDLRVKTGFSKEDFLYYLQASAAYSSNIEGNSIDIDTYLKNKRFKIKSKPKEMAEIDDLIAAYEFAIKKPLNAENFLEAHKLLSKTILSLRSQRGKLRNQQVGIYSGGKIEYMAVEPDFVKEEFDKLFYDIAILINKKLSYKESFYYASMIHLMFEKIHPFMDGNGRAGRLLEKWFLSAKIGEKAWSLETEKYYMKHRSAYYKNIHIGHNFYALHWERSVPFLLMLADCVGKK